MRKMRLMGAALAMGATAASAACTSVEDSSGGSSDAAASTSVTQQSTSAPSTTAATPTESTSGDAPSATSSSRDVGAEISSAAAAPSEQKGLVTAKVGEVAKTSKLSVKVSKVTDPVPVEGSTVFKPGAGKKWVAVTLSVTNVGSEAVDFSPTFCVDAKTNTNSSASTSQFSRYGSPMESSSLQKGDATAGDITFEIPVAQHLKSLDVRCSLDFGGDQRTIRVDLSK